MGLPKKTKKSVTRRKENTEEGKESGGAAAGAPLLLRLWATIHYNMILSHLPLLFLFKFCLSTTMAKLPNLLLDDPIRQLLRGEGRGFRVELEKIVYG
jgi:hypothetical protein